MNNMFLKVGKNLYNLNNVKHIRHKFAHSGYKKHYLVSIGNYSGCVSDDQFMYEQGTEEYDELDKLIKNFDKEEEPINK